MSPPRPSSAEHLWNLPSAFINVGSPETFRDEDIAYAIRRAARSPRHPRGFRTSNGQGTSGSVGT